MEVTSSLCAEGESVVVKTEVNSDNVDATEDNGVFNQTSESQILESDSEAIVKFEEEEQSEEKQFNCSLCGVIVSRAHSLRRHMLRCHNPNRKFAKRGRPSKNVHVWLQCSRCDAVFCKESSLKAHQLTHRSIPVNNLLPQIAAGLLLGVEQGKMSKIREKLNCVKVSKSNYGSAKLQRGSSQNKNTEVT